MPGLQQYLCLAIFSLTVSVDLLIIFPIVIGGPSVLVIRCDVVLRNGPHRTQFFLTHPQLDFVLCHFQCLLGRCGRSFTTIISQALLLPGASFYVGGHRACRCFEDRVGGGVFGKSLSSIVRMLIYLTCCVFHVFVFRVIVLVVQTGRLQSVAKKTLSVQVLRWDKLLSSLLPSVKG